MIIFYNKDGDIEEVNHQTDIPSFNEDMFTLEEILQGYKDRGLYHKVLEEMGAEILKYKVEMDEEFNFIKLIEFEREEVIPGEVVEVKTALEQKVDLIQDAINFILMDNIGGGV